MRGPVLRLEKVLQTPSLGGTPGIPAFDSPSAKRASSWPSSALEASSEGWGDSLDL